MAGAQGETFGIPRSRSSGHQRASFLALKHFDPCRRRCLFVVFLCVASLADWTAGCGFLFIRASLFLPPSIHRCLFVRARASVCLSVCLSVCFSVSIRVIRQSVTQSVSVCLTHPLKPFQDRRGRMCVCHIPCACPYEKRSLLDPVAIQSLTRYSISPP